jgi:hypothetical protein
LDGEIGTGPWPGFNRPESDNLYNAQNLAQTYYGTWLPIIVGATSAGAATYTTVRFGTFYRVGNQVTLTASVAWSAHTGTGGILVIGLPFKPLTPVNAGGGWWGLGTMTQAGANQMALSYVSHDQYWTSSAWAAVSYPRINICTTASAPSAGGNVAAGGTCAVNISVSYLIERTLL